MFPHMMNEFCLFYISQGFVRGEGMEELQTSVDVEIAHEKFVREVRVTPRSHAFEFLACE
jgi:hypothetical protein